jgi:hypothetical protein
VSDSSTVFLRRGDSGAVVEAILRDGLSLEEVMEAEALWQPFLAQALERAQGGGATFFDLPEHKHWDWLRKARHALVRQNFQLMGLQCDGEMQGMMILRTDHVSRLPESPGEPLLYVDYLATAPWNLRSLTLMPCFVGVGRVLVSIAVQESRARGWVGRVGLHSLPQAESFYQRVCGMQDLGQDEGYYKLRYFEMSAADADRFSER